ncbi:Protein transport protein BOS1 [Pleurostoma richardsiae]|uniref:Protein transport protein BOS1 n=1 Tax=Pleurostoma richardsiae TaxID=41990 RepID=A0AA38RU14_9PEZI|nr:Protein transport protein BOS1 [Pleurostoma richardsiae]
MNTTFNLAVKQSKAIRQELSSLSDPSQPARISPAAVGSLSASLTAFSRTLDEYNGLAKQELNPAKQEKALERIKNFRSELAEFRSQFDSVKSVQEDAIHSQNRGELLGRRPYITSTPENPYANTASSSLDQQQIPREDHALREQRFFQDTHAALDQYIAQGQAVLGDLGMQREVLKNTQKRLYSVGNTLGLSGDTIRMIERRAREDKWIFWAGVVVFVLFCWLCLHYLR